MGLPKAAILGLLLLTDSAQSEKTIYHIAVQGSTQLSCKITHKATKAEPYLLLTCEYRCDRPVRGITVDAKSHQDNIYCHKDLPPSPAAQGQSLDVPNQSTPQEEVEDK